GGGCTKGRPHRAPPPPARGGVVEKRQRGGGLAVFGNVSLGRGRQLVAAQPPLKRPAPIQKFRGRGFVETDEGNFVIWALHGPQLERAGLGELRDPLEYSPDHVSLCRVRILVNVLPTDGLIGPDHQSEALNQSVATGAVRIRAANILSDLRGLSVPKHTDADRLDVEMSAGNSVEGVGLAARPAAQIKPPRNTLLLAVEMFEQRDKLVALDQEPGRV